MGRVDLRIVEEPVDRVGEHAEIPISFRVDRVLVLSLVDSGLGGITMSETEVTTPWIKDYDSEKGEGPTRWLKRFDMSNWGSLVAYDAAHDDAHDAGHRVGGAVIAFRAPGVDMLEGRDDLGVLWDLRVRPECRSAGVGSALFRATEDWIRARGGRALKVETQNVNVAACRFYARMGCRLVAIDRRAYRGLPDETQLIWFKEIT